MTQTMMGTDYAGVECIKITRDAWDPVNTPDADRWKFLYNSKWSKDVRVQAVRVGWLGLPKGFNTVESNWDVLSSGPRSGEVYPAFELIKSNLFGMGKGLAYQLPLFQSLETDANGWYVGRRSVRSFLGTQEDTQVDAVREGTYGVEDIIYASGTEFRISVGPAAESGSYFTFAANQSMAYAFPNRKLMVWNLPGDDAPVQNGQPLAPVPGQQQILIGPNFLRVAKTGHNAATATGTQLALDTSQVPAKVLAARDVLVPSGLSAVPIGYPVPPNCVIDCHFYKDGDPIYYPSGPYGEIIGAYYRLNGNVVEFNNPGGALRARFIVLASDNTPATAGANNVLRQFSENGQDVVQFLRPGSGNPPSFADIALDSRWPAMQILREDYLPVPDGYNVSQTVNFDAAGMFPFVKFVTVHGAGVMEGLRAATTPKMIRLPRVTMWNRTGGTSGGWPGGKIMGGDSCFCQYNTNSVTFWTSRGSPKYQARYTRQGGAAEIRSTYDEIPIAGIRYYVFGIAI
ncbi:hypothetical protein ACRQ1B_28980 [Rhizobium panacihumi]|uniref:hypothetical protein n=1 Tax=Rhizobium panacihumi TaxID=2008450 RepID=UPI003D7A5ADB